MKKLFVDTNIVIDLLCNREPHYEDAARLFSLADKKKVKINISSLTIANANFILQKTNTVSNAKLVLRKLKLITTVLPLDDKIIELGLNDTLFSDLEDALQYYTALENDQDVIITRNLKDFKNCDLPVMTAGDFLNIIK